MHLPGGAIAHARRGGLGSACEVHLSGGAIAHAWRGRLGVACEVHLPGGAIAHAQRGGSGLVCEVHLSGRAIAQAGWAWLARCTCPEGRSHMPRGAGWARLARCTCPEGRSYIPGGAGRTFWTNRAKRPRRARFRGPRRAAAGARAGLTAVRPGPARVRERPRCEGGRCRNRCLCADSRPESG